MENVAKRQMSLGLVISYMTIIVQLLSGIIYTPIMLSSLGHSQYGVYSLSISFIGYLTVMNGGANAAYIRFYVQTKVKDEARIPVLNGTFFKIFVVMAFCALGIGVVLGIFSPGIFGTRISESEHQLLRECLFYIAITAWVQILNCVFSSIVVANEKYIFGNSLNFIAALLPMLITIPFLLKGYNCVVIIMIRLIILIVVFLINAVYCFKVLKAKFSMSGTEKAVLKDIAQFAGFIILQGVMDQLNWQVDKFILARVAGTQQISVYTVGSTFNNYYITFAGALSGVFIAQINKLVASKENEKINELFVRSCRTFAYLVWLVMTVFIILGRPFVLRWAGAEYGSSFIVGVLLMAPVTISLTMGLGQDIARAKNKHQLQIFINLFFYVLNVLISVPMAIKFGAIGSAMGTFLTQMITCGVVQPIYYSKVLNLDVRKTGREICKIFKGLIIPIVYGVAINWFDLVENTYVSVFCNGLIYSTLYFVSMWCLVLEKEEKAVVKRILSRIRSVFQSVN